jgi:cysteinyl-tRNA synthetase
MEKLNIQKPDIIRRVTESIDLIIEFIKSLMAKGFAYESNGSVYFNTKKYQQEGWKYPGLGCSIPEESVSQNKDKQHSSDFALWKASEEITWLSPWGNGRPGWHIECSAMASHIFGKHLDIHAGGEDLKFPHHANEIAQSNAYWDVKEWVSTFWHIGHLNIDGKKMSKSLKNFITIRQALDQGITPRQIRILFLMHHWSSQMTYNEETLNHAVDTDLLFEEFFNQVKSGVELKSALRQEGEDLINRSLKTFDFPTMIKDLRGWLRKVNGPDITEDVFSSCARYLHRILKILGLDYNIYHPEKESGLDKKTLDWIISMRDDIRLIAKKTTDPKAKGDLFQLSDSIRERLAKEYHLNHKDRS